MTDLPHPDFTPRAAAEQAARTCGLPVEQFVGAAGG